MALLIDTDLLIDLEHGGAATAGILGDEDCAISAHDLWISATAIAHGLALATRNRAHFERVPGLRVVPS